MKIRTCAALLIAALMLTLTGCAIQAAAEHLDAVEEVAEVHLEATEDKLHDTLAQALEAKYKEKVAQSSSLAEKATPVETLPSAPSVHASKLTQEEAIDIALKHAGLLREQISRLRTEYDYDHRTPEYDIEFREGDWEYEYEIHAETGAILSAEKDD